MKYEPIFEWDEDTKTAACILSDGEKIFYGTANCNPVDEDMCSEKTGCEIAFRRAKIKYYRYYRDCLKERKAALHQLYYSMNKSKKFNENSYENKMLQRQIHQIDFDLDTAYNLLTSEEQSLRTLIQKKDEFYKAVRKNRKGQK
jgi:hypothetical protein